MCSYCGCDSITVIGRFMNEHVEIVNACSCAAPSRRLRTV